MKVKAIEKFIDVETGIAREIGDEWECTEKRAKALAGDGNAARRPLAEIIKEKKVAKTKKA